MWVTPSTGSAGQSARLSVMAPQEDQMSVQCPANSVRPYDQPVRPRRHAVVVMALGVFAGAMIMSWSAPSTYW